VAETLLKTKLFIPPSRTHLVIRPRLIKRLDDGMNYKLTLISAPAGFGKTTLVSSWINKLEQVHPGAENIKVCWISLDKRDNDAIIFWQYVVAAFQTISPAIGEIVKTMLNSMSAFATQVIITMLINEIVEHHQGDRQSQSVILILDDYHLINNQDIHASLNFFLDHLPHFMHLIITTRADPPLQLSYRQGRSEVNQIRAAELSFNTEESVEFLNTQMGLELSQNDILTLENHTEGWITGLQLAAISLQDQPNKQEFVSSFAGDDRYIADYLIDQVLQYQPSHIQDFLLQTSILNQLSAPICKTLTGKDDSQKILNQLENDNLFLSPLDNRREWFRYHSLFADLLKARLRTVYNEDQISELHLQASEWYEIGGELIEAIDHAILGGAHSQAAQLIQQHSEEIFKQSQLNTLANWMQVLPQNVRESKPVLNMIYAWTLLALGQTKKTEDCLMEIQKVIGLAAVDISSHTLASLDANVRGALLEILTIRSVLAINRFDIPKTLELCQIVEPWLTDNEQPHLFNPVLSLRTVILFNLGLAYEFSGDGFAAETAFQEAATLSIEQENIHILPVAISHLGQLQVLQGQLHQAKNTYQQALKSGGKITGKHSPIAGIAEIGLGNLYYEWNDLEQSYHHHKAGLELGKQWNHSEILLAGYLGLALLEKAKGNFTGAFELLQELESILIDNQAHMLLPAVNVFRARLWTYQGNITEANQWLKRADLRLDAKLTYLQESDYITYARILVARQQWDDADKLILRLLKFADSGNRNTRIVELLILQSLIQKGQNQLHLAGETLSRALKIAEPEGYMRIFLDEGPAVATLLFQLVANEAVSSYAREILRAFGALEIESQKEEVSHSDLIEPLSDREIEVLQYLAEGFSNREVAQKLTISLSTVKTHTRNIYGKLGVNSRTQAIAQARIWGIIS
jgi:LuxR family transcriptional regulator, maltose regulon positive regulatory protein